MMTRRGFARSTAGLAAGLLRGAGSGPVDRFLDWRVGLSLHWGPSSQSGLEISWPRGKHGNHPRHIPVAEYDALYTTFNPKKFDASEWVRLARRWGMRYLSPTGKHHDGFALWHSRVSPYTVARTPFRRDVMKELGAACRAGGVAFGSYYSNLDWYHPDWSPYEPEPGRLIPRQADSPRVERYLGYMRAQLAELVRDYRVELLQFDGEWPHTWTHEIGLGMYRHIKAMNPSVVVSSRIDIARRVAGEGGPWDRTTYAGDYEERERMVAYVNHQGPDVRRWAAHPWQAWVTIDRKQWSWNPEPDLLTPDEVIRDLVTTVGHNGNYCINVPPGPDGAFSAQQIRIMDEVGRWLGRHSAAIYGTRGGPFRGPWGVSTQSGRRVYLHLLAPSSDRLELRHSGGRLESARWLTGPSLGFEQTDSALVLALAGRAAGPVATVELVFQR